MTDGPIQDTEAMGMSPNPQMTEGQLLPSGGGAQELLPTDGALQGLVDGKLSQQHFQFDPATTGTFLNQSQGATAPQDQQNSGLNHSTSLSQGNLYSYNNNSNAQHFMPHTSCTSIQTQNLSTSDQQPLIVDANNDLHLKHRHYFCHPRQHSHLSQSHTHEQSICSHPNNNNSLLTCLNNQHPTKQQPFPYNPLPVPNHCCNHFGTTTTSFMANQNQRKSSLHQDHSNDADTDDLGDMVDDTDECAFCCEPSVEFAGGDGQSVLQNHSHSLRKSLPIGGSYQQQQVRSRTLTRTYKPLNDTQSKLNTTVDDLNYIDVIKRRKNNDL